MYKMSFLNKFLGTVIVATSMLLSNATLSAGEGFKPIKFETEKLDNGLTVIYHVDKSAPIVATVVHYNVGSKDEDLDKTGYAHFFEHLMFEATDAIPRATIDKLVQEAGGELNAYTSFDQTVFHFSLPANEVRLALWVESQRMRHLHVDEIGVETQRGVVTEELKMRTTNQPYGSLIQKLCSSMFPGSGYAWAVIGSEEHIKRATIQNFKDFYDNFYQANNATLVIAGDFDIKDVKQYVRDYFGSLPKAPEPKRHDYQLQPLTKEIRETVEDDKAPMTGLFIGFQGPKLNDPDFYAASLLTDILAAGESSRFYQRIVDKEQLAVETSFSPFILRGAGAFLVEAYVAKDKTPKEVEKAIMEEINKVVADGVTDAELTKAKNIREAQFVFGKKDLMDKAQELARNSVFYANPGLINTELDKFLKVTKDDIIKAAKKYLATDKKVVLVYTPKNS
jgi:predicted Zn-dependent peptidase